MERKHPDLTMTPGQAAHREVESIQHGTLCFIVNRDVATGQVLAFIAYDNQTTAKPFRWNYGKPLQASLTGQSRQAA